MHTGLEARPSPRMQWPWDVQLREWKVILRRVAHEVSDDNVSMVAAALSFYAMLALFPGLIALDLHLRPDRGPRPGLGSHRPALAPSCRATPGSRSETQLHALVSTREHRVCRWACS